MQANARVFIREDLALVVAIDEAQAAEVHLTPVDAARLAEMLLRALDKLFAGRVGNGGVDAGRDLAAEQLRLAELISARASGPEHETLAYLRAACLWIESVRKDLEQAKPKGH